MGIQSIHTLSLTSNGRDWLVNSSQPSILHIFDHACNLINERKEVLSIVTPQIGNGPFNLVLKEEVSFPEHLSLHAPVCISGKQLSLGELTIHTDHAKLWNPRPNWEKLHAKKEDILAYGSEMAASQTELLAMTGIGTCQSPMLEFSNSLLSSLAAKDLPASIASAKQLAGLGIGLTPSGDDFILGALHAAWIMHPPEIAQLLAREVANTASPLTTSLSGAWLRSAGNGEAGILWHEFFNTLIGVETARVQSSLSKILAVGETSGADALAGFIGTLISYVERETKPCHS